MSADTDMVIREYLAVAHEGAKKPLIALDIRTGNIGRQGVAWVETTTALAAIRAALDASGIGEMVEALTEARRLCDQVPVDLSSAHAEICKLQGLDPAKYSWPDWTPQANTLRWLEKLVPQIDVALSRARATVGNKDE